MPQSTDYDYPEEGLYFDGGLRSAGETDVEVIRLAEQYGFTFEGEADPDYEFINEIADEAIDFLNSLETREGYSWGFGENAEGFGLWRDSEE
jgi:hypothetical protein